MAKAKQQVKESFLVSGRHKLAQLVARIKNLPYSEMRTRLLELWQKLRHMDRRKVLSAVKQARRKAYQKIRKLKKPILKIMKHWRFLTIFLPSFLFFYYLVGSTIADNTNVNVEYKIPEEEAPTFATAESMSFLIKREVDGKMWTPNLPLIFPASVLDNMPNFQIGVVSAVREMLPPIRRFAQNNEQQKADMKTAYKLLSYPPNVWLMSRRGKLGLAPSSNSQYRKAAAKLHDFSADGDFTPQAEDLNAMLSKMSKNLQNLTIRNEIQQRENAGGWWDTSADDLFYFARGYAYALWQISQAAAVDFKDILLECNLYTEWTYLVTSLKKAAEFKPRVIRNGAADSLFTPNHLLMQNYYLQRAMTAAEKIRNGLLKEQNAD